MKAVASLRISRDDAALPPKATAAPFARTRLTSSVSLPKKGAPSPAQAAVLAKLAALRAQLSDKAKQVEADISASNRSLSRTRRSSLSSNRDSPVHL